MNQNNLRKIFLAVCIALGVVGIVLLAVGVFAISFDDVAFIKVMVIIISVLCILASAEFAYMCYIENEVKPNYFLYDQQAKKNISLEKMDFNVINRKMNTYLRGFAASEGKLWTDRVLDDPDLKMEDKFKPAVAYRLLFGLADKDVDQGWKCFELASVETVEFICNALDANGDTDVARTLRHLKAANPINLKYVRDYLVNNKSYLRTKLCNYVYDNINKF
ncbi:MAG: hypothetical protein IJ011_06620 [Clostridia bacterium]|nr:hypothetical protein [Clostridia bacterium]